MNNVTRRPGRPRKFEGANLESVFQIRALKNQIEAWKRKAKSIGKAASTWARDILNDAAK